MSDLFYSAFLDFFYASREHIKMLREKYIPFVQLLYAHFRLGQALDLGCGRGEWLEMINEIGLQGVGVDLDEGMVEACRCRHLQVNKEDGCEFLEKCDAESQIVITSFQVVEHLDHDHLLRMMKEAYRVLKPGGMLILETPNPENIWVATNTFYVDPTHTRPIPPRYLQFLADFYGFGRTIVLRVNENVHQIQANRVSLMDVLSAVSPDYALVAQKTQSADSFLLADTEDLFRQSSGIALPTLTQRYDLQIQQRIDEVAQIAREAEEKASLQKDQLHAVYTSASWRVTAPLRCLGMRLSYLKALPVSVVTYFLQYLYQRIQSRPILSIRVHALLKRFPRVMDIVMKWVVWSKLAEKTPNQMEYLHHLGVDIHDSSRCNERVRSIYHDLKNEMER